jgi:CrcB protein
MTVQWSLVLAIAAGGALGAVARFLAMSAVGHWLGHGFPWGTLLVNVAGSFALGILVEIMALTWQPAAEIRAFLVVGLLGAFTTFSTFSLDVFVLAEGGARSAALGYILASVCLSVLGLFLGLRAGRLMLG